MRLELQKNSIEIVPDTEVDEYYLEQFIQGECQVVIDSETETIKPTHADENEKYVTKEQIKLMIWPLQVKTG